MFYSSSELLGHSPWKPDYETPYTYMAHVDSFMFLHFLSSLLSSSWWMVDLQHRVTKLKGPTGE